MKLRNVGFALNGMLENLMLQRIKSDHCIRPHAMINLLPYRSLEIGMELWNIFCMVNSVDSIRSPPNFVWEDIVGIQRVRNACIFQSIEQRFSFTVNDRLAINRVSHINEFRCLVIRNMIGNIFDLAQEAQGTLVGIGCWEETLDNLFLGHWSRRKIRGKISPTWKEMNPYLRWRNRHIHFPKCLLVSATLQLLSVDNRKSVCWHFSTLYLPLSFLWCPR